MLIQRLASNLNILGFDASTCANGSMAIDNKLFTARGVNNSKDFECICLFLFDKINADRAELDLKGNLDKFSCAGKKTFVYKVYKWLIEIRGRSSLFDQIPIRRSELLSYQGKNLVKNMAALSKYVVQIVDDKDIRYTVQKTLALKADQSENTITAAKIIESRTIKILAYRPYILDPYSYTLNCSFNNVSASSSLSLREEASISLPSLREYLLGNSYGPELKPLNWYLPLVDKEMKSKSLLLTQRFTPPPHLIETPSPSPTSTRKKKI